MNRDWRIGTHIEMSLTLMSHFDGREVKSEKRDPDTYLTRIQVPGTVNYIHLSFVSTSPESTRQATTLE